MQVNEIMSKNPGVISKPLLKARLSDKQWEQIMKINDILVREYTTRREMILKRLDVTIQSFLWSEAAKVGFFFYVWFVSFATFHTYPLNLDKYIINLVLRAILSETDSDEGEPEVLIL